MHAAKKLSHAPGTTPPKTTHLLRHKLKAWTVVVQFKRKAMNRIVRIKKKR
jgi:hypothetical protein